MAKKPEGGASPLRFNNQENLDAWLKTQPHEVAVAIAARAALRVLPLTAGISPLLLARHREELILAIIEANAVARLAAKHPSQSIDNRVARRAWEAANAADATDAAAYAAGAAAAFAVSNPARAVARAADATAYARARRAFRGRLADSASILMRGTFAATMWEVVSNDANLIDLGRSASDLASRPLWPDRAPDWASDHWGRLRDALPQEDDWQVWIDWYKRRLDGFADPKDFELVFATVPKGKWNEGPAAVNRWIKQRLEELQHKNEEKPDPAFDSAAIERLLTQDFHGATMEIVGGKARIASALHEDDASAAQDAQTVQLHKRARVRAAAARDRVQRLANQPGFEAIAVTVDEFARLLSGDTLSVAANIGMVWELSTAVGTFTERDEEVKAGRGGMTPQMDADARESLDQLLMIAAPFVRRFPTARQNDEEVRRFKQTRESIEASKRIFDKVSKENLIESQSQTIIVIATSAAERGEGIQAEKSRSWLNKSARNLLVAFMIAAGAAGTLTIKFGEKAVEEFYDNSQSREFIQKFLRDTEKDAFELFRDLPPDLGRALRELYRRLGQGRDPPPFDPTERV